MDEKKAMEDIINMTYPGLTMLYRDVNLGDLCNIYKEGMIIRERAYTMQVREAAELLPAIALQSSQIATRMLLNSSMAPIGDYVSCKKGFIF